MYEEYIQGSHEWIESRKYLVKEKEYDRFISKVEITENCWIWKAGKMKSGYGLFWLDKQGSAHRASWILHNGEIPKGLCVCHKCDNPSCVNPDHLFLGTHKENTQDAIKKKRLVLQKTKIPKDQHDKIIHLYENGMTQREIGKIYNANQRQIWKIICKKHPSQGPRLGSRNNKSKLKEEDILEIRRIHLPYIYSKHKIAEKFNVSLSTIDRIIRRETWNHI